MIALRRASHGRDYASLFSLCGLVNLSQPVLQPVLGLHAQSRQRVECESFSVLQSRLALICSMHSKGVQLMYIVSISSTERVPRFPKYALDFSNGTAAEKSNLLDPVPPYIVPSAEAS